MSSILSYAVGAGGKKDGPDVFIIQELLNLYHIKDPRIPLLKVDGDAGKNTKDAIKLFQTHVMKLKVPDSRIDPGGGTEKLLRAKLAQEDIDAIVKKYKPAAAIPGKQAPAILAYGENARHELSHYTEKIIKLAMFYTNVNKVDITSTRRTPADQARIMYDTCRSVPGASNSEEMYAVRGYNYKAPGLAVEKVYYANKDKPPHEIKLAMMKEIQAQTAKGQIVSNHLAEPGVFSSYNVLDIAYNTVDASKREKFSEILSGMASDIQSHKIIHPININMPDYISRLIIEKFCWHIEIKQTGKELPDIPSC